MTAISAYKTTKDTDEHGLTFAVKGNPATGALYVESLAGTPTATTAEKAEDAASANGDVGIPAMAIRKATPANTSDTDGDYEMLQMSAGRLWTSAQVESAGHSATVTITRPSDTDAYTAGDAVGDTGGSAILTFANMARAAGEVIITSIELEIDVDAVPSGMTGFNVRLYNASPTAIADNAAWDLPSGDRGKYLGKVSLTTPTDEGSTLFSDNDGINKQITLTSTSLYVVLQTVGGYTPSSAAVKRLTIHTVDV
jgi:hypothetical protein